MMSGTRRTASRLVWFESYIAWAELIRTMRDREQSSDGRRGFENLTRTGQRAVARSARRSSCWAPSMSHHDDCGLTKQVVWRMVPTMGRPTDNNVEEPTA